MIRQAISCDICGTEKKQTNHWFVAWEQGGELRVSGWNSRNRLRAGSMHLCGQACLHKLADEFMARVIAGKAASNLSAEVAEEAPAQAPSDTSLTAAPAQVEFESSARLVASAPAEPRAGSVVIVSQPVPRPVAGPIAISERPQQEPLPPIPDEPPRFTSRSWRAEAWERERERTQHANDGKDGHHRPALVARRISQA